MHGQLAREFAETAARLRGHDPAGVLDAIVVAAPAVGSRHAGLMLRGPGPMLRRGCATDALAADAVELIPEKSR